MARKVHIAVVDDMNPDLEADEAIAFTFEGVDYEIDLAAENAEKFRHAIAPYVAAARRVGGRKARAGRPAPTRSVLDREQTRAIRAWAKSAGHAISERGRIPQAVVDAYNQSR